MNSGSDRGCVGENGWRRLGQVESTGMVGWGRRE